MQTTRADNVRTWGKPVIGVDWSIKNGVCAYDGVDHIFVPDLLRLLDSLTVPSVVVLEASFDSYDVEFRELVISSFENSPHDLLTVNPRQTAAFRRKWYPDYEKVQSKDSDKFDAELIYQMVMKSNVLFHRATPREHIPALFDIKRDLMKLRRSYTTRVSTRAATGFVKDSDKELWAKELVKRLPDYHTLDTKLQDLLGDGKSYSLVLVATVGVISRHVKSRKLFDTVAGFHGNGYPSQQRSDFYRNWHQLNKRWKKNGLPTRTLTEYQHATRWLFHQLKAFSDQIPFK